MGEKKNHSGSALGWSTDSVRTEPWLPVENGHREGCGIFRNEILICLISVLTRADDDTCRHSGVKWERRSHGNAIRRPLSNRRPHSSRRFQLASQVQSPPALSPSSDFIWYFSIINFFFPTKFHLSRTIWSIRQSIRLLGGNGATGKRWQRCRVFYFISWFLAASPFQNRCCVFSLGK